LAIADMMIAVLNGSRRTFEDGFQAFLSFEKGQPVYLLAVEKQKVKDEIHKYTRLPVRPSSVAACISEKKAVVPSERTVHSSRSR
jgi:hypothetical protein